MSLPRELKFIIRHIARLKSAIQRSPKPSTYNDRLKLRLLRQALRIARPIERKLTSDFMASQGGRNG